MLALARAVLIIVNMMFKIPQLQAWFGLTSAQALLAMEYNIEATTELTLSYIKLLIESCQMKLICGCDSGIMCEHSICKDKNVRMMA